MAADQREVWTAIADSFDRTRQRPWPHVVEFLQGLPEGSRVLDLMGGNGRHGKAAIAAGHDVLALDWSLPLLRRAPGGPGDRVLADATRLPLRSGSFDACVFVAGLHGLPSPEHRAACLAELHRVLPEGGTAQVTVWSRDAPRFRGQGTPGQPIDVEVPWRSGSLAETRHYHLYTAASLREALGAAGFTVDRLLGVAVAAQEPDNLVATLRRAASA
ncbi:MAG TPA: class I SAM-dependent methyltransferase [Candidatus Thermoplasmatota archaeon]|nr:class I SAM-dependent methyltransferase [Candidatus Thermoplasmatota archaeon]